MFGLTQVAAALSLGLLGIVSANGERSSSLQTQSPVIGIWAHPLSEIMYSYKGDAQYVAASYVKWVEGAGGRATVSEVRSDSNAREE